MNTDLVKITWNDLCDAEINLSPEITKGYIEYLKYINQVNYHNKLRKVKVKKFISNENKSLFYINNRNILVDYQRNYRQTNKEHINKWRRTKIKCKCGTMVNNSYKSTHIRTNSHIEKMNEINAVENTKKKYNRYEKVKCDCGGKYTNNSKARHDKTKKHLKHLE